MSLRVTEAIDGKVDLREFSWRFGRLCVVYGGLAAGAVLFYYLFSVPKHLSLIFAWLLIIAGLAAGIVAMILMFSRLLVTDLSKKERDRSLEGLIGDVYESFPGWNPAVLSVLISVIRISILARLILRNLIDLTMRMKHRD